MQAVLSLVAVEAGLALVPLSMSGFRPGEVAYFPIEDHRAAFDRSLLRRKDVENAAVRHFIEMVGV